MAQEAFSELPCCASLKTPLKPPLYLSQLTSRILVNESCQETDINVGARLEAGKSEEKCARSRAWLTTALLAYSLVMSRGCARQAKALIVLLRRKTLSLIHKLAVSIRDAAGDDMPSSRSE